MPWELWWGADCAANVRTAPKVGRPKRNKAKSKAARAARRRTR